MDTNLVINFTGRHTRELEDNVMKCVLNRVQISMD
jgi:hypothetical protein